MALRSKEKILVEEATEMGFEAVVSVLGSDGSEVVLFRGNETEAGASTFSSIGDILSFLTLPVSMRGLPTG